MGSAKQAVTTAQSKRFCEHRDDGFLQHSYLLRCAATYNCSLATLQRLGAALFGRASHFCLWMRCANYSPSIRPRGLLATALSLSGQTDVQILLASVLPATLAHTTQEFWSPKPIRKLKQLTKVCYHLAALPSLLSLLPVFRGVSRTAKTISGRSRVFCVAREARAREARYGKNTQAEIRWRPPPSRSTSR